MPSFKTRALALKREIMTLWFVLRHPDTPWYAKALAAMVTAYALSPIDLIPDFIPIIGYLDDIIIVPAGIWLIFKILPPVVLQDCRAQAAQWQTRHLRKPRSYVGLAFMITLWAFAAWAIFRWLTR